MQNHFEVGYEFTDTHGVKRYVHLVDFVHGEPRYETYPVAAQNVNAPNDAPFNSDDFDIFEEHELYELQIQALKAQVAAKSNCMPTIAVDTTLGKLCATIGGDPKNYPEIFVYLKRPDGVEIDLVAADINQDERCAKAYLYGDTARDDYTKSFGWSEDEININCD